MAFAAGNQVVTSAGTLPVTPHRKRPLLGTVESIGPVVVAWADGTRTSFAAVGSGGTAVLFKVQGPTHASLLGFVVQVTGLANPGERLQGPVVMHFNIEDNAGTPISELVVIDTPSGFVVIAYSAVTVVPDA